MSIFHPRCAEITMFFHRDFDYPYSRGGRADGASTVTINFYLFVKFNLFVTIVATYLAWLIVTIFSTVPILPGCTTVVTVRFNYSSFFGFFDKETCKAKKLTSMSAGKPVTNSPSKLGVLAFFFHIGSKRPNQTMLAGDANAATGLKSKSAATALCGKIF